MRKANAIVSHLILVLFLIHGVLGAFNLMGLGSVTTHLISHAMVTIIGVHAVLGSIFTVRTLKAQKKAGASYFKDNLLFWARRISGFAVMILIAFHMLAFMGVSAEHYRLPNFDGFKLALQMLLVVAVAFHIIANVKPMLISLGIPKLKPRATDIIFWISVLMAFMAVAFIIYYLRWVAV